MNPSTYPSSETLSRPVASLAYNACKLCFSNLRQGSAQDQRPNNLNPINYSDGFHQLHILSPLFPKECIYDERVLGQRRDARVSDRFATHSERLAGRMPTRQRHSAFI